MRMMKNRRRLSCVISLLLMINLCLGYMLPMMNSLAYTERAATVNATTLNVRSAPGTGNSLVTKLYHGASVTVIGEKNASDGSRWYQIRFNANGSDKTGYVLDTYIKFPVTYTNDADFESYLNSQGFPESYKPGLRQLHAEYPNWVFTAQKTNLDWNDAVNNESVVGRNLVGSGSISSWKSTADGAYNWDNSTWPGFDTSAWVAASPDIIRYYMDPRNFLDSTYVFQFLLQRFDANQQTRAGIESMINGTFMSGASVAGDNSGSGGGGNGPAGNSAGPGGSGTNSTDSGPGVSGGGGDGAKLEGPQASISKRESSLVTSSYGPGMAGDSAGPGGTGSSGGSDSGSLSGSTNYPDIILNAGAQSGVNPYVLTAMILQEQGPNGSGSCSGTTAGYEGYYNFFNIEAYASGSLTPVQRGLWYASQSGNYGRPWNSVEKAILGGAEYYGSNYLKAGQDTFYLKKYNVQGSSLYKHQYMTNVQGAASEAAKLAKAYSAEMKKTALEFKIPVFNNMPDSACARPTGEGSPNNKLSNLSVSGFSITPTFSRDTLEYDLIVDPSVSGIQVSASAYDSKAVVSGTGSISLQSGNNEIKITVKAENGSIREYILHVVRQGGGQTGGGQGSQPGGPGAGGPGGAPGPGESSAPAQNVTSPAAETVAAPAQTSAGPEQSFAAPAQTAPARGDVNGDGAITAADVAAIQKHILGQQQLSGTALQAADVNGDGSVDVKDTLQLQRQILGL